MKTEEIRRYSSGFFKNARLTDFDRVLQVAWTGWWKAEYLNDDYLELIVSAK